MTKNFISPARFFTERTLMNTIDQLRNSKLPDEMKVDEATTNQDRMNQPAVKYI